MLAAIGAATGRALRFEEVDAAGAAELFPGAPDELVAAIVAGQRSFLTEPEPVGDALAQVLGRPALTFAQWARDHAAAFGAAGSDVSGPGSASR